MHRENKTKLLVYSLWCLTWQNNFFFSKKRCILGEDGKVGVRVFIPCFKGLFCNVLLQLLDCCVLQQLFPYIKLIHKMETQYPWHRLL